MNKPARKVEVPGAPQLEETAETPATPATLKAPDPSEDQARTHALEAQVEATKDLVGSDQALDWSHLTTPHLILQKINHNPDADLPHPDEIDWSKIKGDRVLTRQGWLLKNG